MQEIGEVLLPALCPLSATHADATVQLGRETAWETDQRFGEIPFGAKTMVVDGVERPLLELRDLQWSVKETGDGPA